MILYLDQIFVIKIFVRLDFGSASTVQMYYLQKKTMITNDAGFIVCIKGFSQCQY